MNTKMIWSSAIAYFGQQQCYIPRIFTQKMTRKVKLVGQGIGFSCTCLTKSKQRWYLMSLLSPSGRFLIISHSSTPRIAAHRCRS